MGENGLMRGPMDSHGYTLHLVRIKRCKSKLERGTYMIPSTVMSETQGCLIRVHRVKVAPRLFVARGVASLEHAFFISNICLIKSDLHGR